MLYPLQPESAVCGIRFQPIFSLAERKIHSWEVLSMLKTGLNHEYFFSYLSDELCLNILRWQLRTVMTMFHRQRYYFNIPARVFCKTHAIEHITPFLRPGIVIEIQDPQGLMALSTPEKDSFYKNIVRLRRTGAEIWLDDILPEQINMLEHEIEIFDGVKIDKSVLHESTDKTDVLTAMIAQCSRKVNAIVIEGIEHSEHFAKAAKTGCHYLQGFMWPEKKMMLRYNE
ncbi:TPA: EAL domain-containing protein [Enterobacter asburiae]|uniref:EAL domain-containing protein n=1 Tax=Enterobacter asburiae TaxID=61645 RepID=UPI00075C7DA0|nr:EAL domain-containing protein [Enterobacter asburiae]SAG26114.1 FOG: EAL domain [Enterobacter cloacae]KVJ80266.1 hypothetical protein AWS24_06165 [Enterobacter asburiae]MDL4614290.1 EAL domain-containing protein [Enterobacter asburiae]HCM9129863.1 EAL domain-containing protein [Enterobacter asburiae]HDW1997278.1 EAL domain-containing protein [Enterobacter asburiae]